MKNSKNKKITFILSLTCFLILTSFTVVYATPNNTINHNIDLIAGSSRCIQETITNPKDYPVNITDFNHIITNQNKKTILEGITITIHKKIGEEPLELPVTIPAGETFNFYICYNTDIRLKPDTYTMKTDFTIEKTDYDTTETEENKIKKGTVRNIILSGNIPPTADADEPYYGFPDEKITFDGSKSYAQEGKNIVGYRWNFTGNDTWDTDWLNTPYANHTYTSQGIYTVTLQVKDNDDLTDKNTTTVTILAGNLPPTQPTVTGETNGSKNINYTYTALSTDPDNDMIQYIFNWGDKTNTTTDFLPNETNTTENHSWTSAGKYHMQIKARDNKNASSETKELTILIDAINVEDIGYLTDDDSDETYDTYHSNNGTIQTTVEKIDDKEYLLNTTVESRYNYIFKYYPKTEEWTLIDYEPSINIEPMEEDNTFFYIGAILLVSILLILLFLAKRKKDKGK